MRKNSTVTLVIFGFATLFMVAFSNPTQSNKKLIYSEAANFTLLDDISKGLGYESIEISKGDYPISFDKNKNGQLTVNVLKLIGKGNGGPFSLPMAMRRKGYCNGNYCICWGLGCKVSNGPRIKYKFTLLDKKLLVIDFLEKAPFGEPGFQMQ